MNKLWHIHTMECYSMSKTRREEMTGKWKIKMYDGCRECHHVSKIQGRWTDTCVPIWMGCLGKETREQTRGSLRERDLVARRETEMCFYCVCLVL